MRQLTVYDGIRTHARLVLRWQVRAVLDYERDLIVAEDPTKWERELPKDVRQRERLRVATERAMRRYARERLRENVRAALIEMRGSWLRVIEGGKSK